MIPERGELSPTTRKWVSALTVLLCVAALASWALLAWRERFLCDDAFISFRYSDHFARGLGLVWNAGERVEGYTNFLWVLLLAAGLRLGLAPEVSSQALGLASAFTLLVALFLAGGKGPLGRLRGAFMALLLAAHGSFGAWSTSGLETMFFTLLVWLATWRFVVERRCLVEPRDAARRPWLAAVLFALASLTRPEGALFAGLAGLFLLVETVRGRAGVRALFTFALTYALPVAAHVVWRYAYYGDWLPNTFRAKVPGAWFDHGLAYLGLYEAHYHAAAFAPLALLAFLGRRRAEAALVLAGLASYLAYVVTVGGDRFEFRFLVVVLPHFVWLVVEGASALVERAAARETRRALALVAGIVLLALLYRTLRGFTPRDVDRHGIASIARIRQFAERRTAEGKHLRSWIERGRLPAELVIAVRGAGALPYYTRWKTIDRHGLNDVWIARQPVSERGLIAHEKDAPYSYLLERDVVAFDFQNHLVLTQGELERIERRPEHDGHVLPLRAIRLDGTYFVFAALVPDEELDALFPDTEVLKLLE